MCVWTPFPVSLIHIFFLLSYITGRVYRWLETWCRNTCTHSPPYGTCPGCCVVSACGELGPSGILCPPCGNIGGHCWVFRASSRWGRTVDVNLAGSPKILGQQGSPACVGLCVSEFFGNIKTLIKTQPNHPSCPSSTSCHY